MRLTDRLRSIFAFGRVPPVDPSTRVFFPWVMTAGVPVTPITALEVGAVYACCRVIVDSLASQPVEVYATDRDGNRSEVLDTEVGWLLNVRPNPECTPIAVREGLLWSALTWGNGYAEIVRTGANKPAELWPLPPESVTPRRRPDRSLYYEVTGPDFSVRELEPRDVFHLRGPSLQGWMGDSPTTRAAKAIGIAMASQAFSSAYFANGTQLSGYLATEQVLSADQLTAMSEQWNAKYTGPDNASKTAVLMKGTKYVPLGANAAESKLIETRGFQVADIARFYGVPLSLLMDPEGSQGYGTNVEQLYLTFSKTALKPWAVRFDQEATYKFFPERNIRRCVETDLTRLTQGDFKTVIDAVRAAVEGGILTRNEARERLGWNTTGDDGDVFLVGASVKRLEDVLDPPEPQPEPAKPAGGPAVKTGAPIPDPEDDDS